MYVDYSTKYQDEAIAVRHTEQRAAISTKYRYAQGPYHVCIFGQWRLVDR